MILPTALLGFRLIDYFDEELVCVHVYRLSRHLPRPLKRPQKSIKRLNDGSYFQIGLSELIVCRTEKSLLKIFNYFWPVMRPEIQHFENSSEILFSLPVIEHVGDFTAFETALNQDRGSQKGLKKMPPIGGRLKLRTPA
jgi:hypothetical protein